MAFHEYIDAQRKNLESALKLELFGATCPEMDKLYEVSIGAVPNDIPPIGAVPNDRSPVFAWFLLICHKSFLGAATLIGQAQPDDSEPITRRAIEIVRLAAAIKQDSAIAAKWVAYEERMERWKMRDEGKRPKPLNIHIPVKHPLVRQLMDTWGIISDSAVHFTPEYFNTLRWEKRDDKMFLHYFTGEQRNIESAIIQLLGVHMMMLQILDECLDGALSENSQWQEIRDKIHAVAKPCAEKFEHAG